MKVILKWIRVGISWSIGSPAQSWQPPPLCDSHTSWQREERSTPESQETTVPHLFPSGGSWEGAPEVSRKRKSRQVPAIFLERQVGIAPVSTEWPHRAPGCKEKEVAMSFPDLCGVASHGRAESNSKANSSLAIRLNILLDVSACQFFLNEILA